MNPLAAIGAIASAISNWLSFAKDRSALKNSEAMQAAKARENESGDVDQVNKEIAAKDVDALRKELSE